MSAIRLSSGLLLAAAVAAILALLGGFQWFLAERAANEKVSEQTTKMASDFNALSRNVTEAQSIYLKLMVENRAQRQTDLDDAYKKVQDQVASQVNEALKSPLESIAASVTRTEASAQLCANHVEAAQAAAEQIGKDRQFIGTVLAKFREIETQLSNYDNLKTSLQGLSSKVDDLQADFDRVSVLVTELAARANIHLPPKPKPR